MNRLMIDILSAASSARCAVSLLSISLSTLIIINHINQTDDSRGKRWTSFANRHTVVHVLYLTNSKVTRDEWKWNQCYSSLTGLLSWAVSVFSFWCCSEQEGSQSSFFRIAVCHTSLRSETKTNSLAPCARENRFRSLLNSSGAK